MSNKNKKIAITGCCGTVGHAILTVLSKGEHYRAIVGIDNNESGLFSLQQEFDARFHFVFGDIRDQNRLEDLFTDMDVVIHTAALKHVYSCEYAPSEAIKTNIIGVDNVIAASRKCGVHKTLFTSSDKAVNPTNVMGTSKLMGERLMSAAQATYNRNNENKFFSTRFGNVLGSHGSVFPLFCKQIKNGGPITITDPEMTRFVMSTSDAVHLVLESLELAHGGEVFVSKMRALKIMDLAEVMIEYLAPHYCRCPKDIEIKIIGAKPGEKIYEELLTEEESGRAIQLDKFYVILPAFRDFYGINYVYDNLFPCQKGITYRSNEQPLLTKPQIYDYLISNRLLPKRDK